MAIAAPRRRASGGPGPEIRVFATDVDRTAIDFARRGVYPPGALRGVPAPLRGRYFVPSAAGFEVVRQVRSRMVFGEHDLSARVPFPRIDLLLCRNVLIYFTCRSSGSPWRRSPTPSARTGGSSSAVRDRRRLPGPVR